MRGDGRVYRVEAVVLRRLSVGETDRIVTLFTRDRGKLNAIAKGARGPRGRLGGATEPFTLLRGLLATGQNLDVLTQAETVQAFPGIRKDLERMAYASHFLELTDAGLEERQPAAALWDLLVGALRSLEGATTPDVLTRAFELHALSILGYEPQLHACVLDEAALGPGAVFHPLRGGMLCGSCARQNRGGIPVDPDTRAALLRLRQEAPARAGRSPLPRAVRTMLSRCLIPYVRSQLETPLRSLQFLDALK